MNWRYLIILLFLCNNNCGGSPSGCGCGGNGQRNGQRNGQKNSQRERGCGCDNSFGYGDGMMQTREFAGFANNGTCGCEEKQENDCLD